MELFAILSSQSRSDWRIIFSISVLTPEQKCNSLEYILTFVSSVNHRELLDNGRLTREDGEGLQVYYHDNGQQPFQIDRVISGLGTKSATVHFRLQAPISSNTADDVSYFLVLGASVSGSAMDDPAKVYAYFDDFSTATLNKEWVKNWGKWSVQNGRLLHGRHEAE